MAQWKLNFSDLELEERIGKGNFGEVYKGSLYGTEVAIKKLYFVDDDFMQKYIEREMDTLTGIHHPNIVQLMGLCIETNDMYIVTEYVNGGDLRNKLKDKTVELSWPKRVKLALDIALAMNYLHSKNLMHRDLKSHNLLVGENWRIKVCDFGLARKEEGGDYMTIVGTNEWMAPEVAMGEKYDKSADVFSYGMVLCELMTRQKPPERKLIKAYAFEHDSFEGSIPKDTPRQLWDLFVECSAFNPADRPSFQDIVNELKAVVASMDEEDEAPAKKKKAAGEAPKKKKKKKKKQPAEDEDGEAPKKKKKKKKKKKQPAEDDDEDAPKKKKKKKKKKKPAADDGEEDAPKKTKKKKKKKKKKKVEE